MQVTPNPKLLAAITGTAEILGYPLSPSAAALMLADLAEYPGAAVLAALTAIRRESAGKLTLAAVLTRIEAATTPQRLAPNEAWALVVRAQDERETVVWTDEMAQAWTAVGPLVQAGDLVAARMAFLEAYQRIVTAHRRDGRTPAVSVSWGWDREARGAGIEAAISSGMISRQWGCAEAAGLGVYIAGPQAAALLAPDAGDLGVGDRLRELCATLAADLRQGKRAQLEAQQAEFEAQQAALATLKADALASLGIPIAAEPAPQ